MNNKNTVKRKKRGKPFSKGDERINRAGRPKGKPSFTTPTDLLKKYLAMTRAELKKVLVTRGDLLTNAEVAVIMMIQRSTTEKGHATLVDMFNRVEGYPTQRQEVSTESEPVHIIIERVPLREPKTTTS